MICPCCKKDVTGIHTCNRSKCSTAADLQAQLHALKEFARYVIPKVCWSFNDLDPCDLQELSERLGLIVVHKATEADVDNESDFEVGDVIFEYSSILKEQKDGKEEADK